MSLKCCLEERQDDLLAFWAEQSEPYRHMFLTNHIPFYVLQVNWHDFAFFDPVMYESLRQLIRHSQAGEAEAVFAAMDLAFAIDLCKEEGAGQVKYIVINISESWSDENKIQLSSAK